jgi:hypothetical protein
MKFPVSHATALGLLMTMTSLLTPSYALNYHQSSNLRELDSYLVENHRLDVSEVLIARGNPMQIALQVFNSPQIKNAIIHIANKKIGTSRVRVDNVVFEVDNGRLKMTLSGKIKIPVLRDKTFFLSSFYSPIFAGNTVALAYRWYDQPHLHVSRCRRPCRKRRNHMYITTILPLYNNERGFEADLNQVLRFVARR